MKKISILLFVLVLVGNIASAQVTEPTNTGGPNNPSSSQDLSSSTVGVKNIQLTNPLGSVKTLPVLIEKILRIVLSIGTPVIALAIIYAGFQFVAAQGNPTKLQEARRTLLYVIIGAGILLASYVIAESIFATINSIRGN
mgnify:CR=1 FL=1